MDYGKLVQQPHAFAEIMQPSPPNPPQDGLPTPRRYVAIAAIGLGTVLTVIDGRSRPLPCPPSRATCTSTGRQRSSSSPSISWCWSCRCCRSRRWRHRRLKRLYQGRAGGVHGCDHPVLLRQEPAHSCWSSALQAIGAAAALSVMSALIRSIYPQRQLGRGLGVNSVIVSISAALAPTGGRADPRGRALPWVFAMGAPFAILSLWLAPGGCPTCRRAPPYNLAGAMLNAAAFGLPHRGYGGLGPWRFARRQRRDRPARRDLRRAAGSA